MANKYTISEDLIGERLDKAVTKLLQEKSRNYVTQLIDQDLVTVNGQSVKSSYKVRANDEIEVGDFEIEEVDVEPENIPLDIVYEDSDVLVINKPVGLVVHPANGHYTGTVVNALLYHIKDLSGINGVKRPGIVHRIDKDTSGLLLVCKNDFAHEKIAKQLEDHSMYREYYALVNGVIKENAGKVIAPIGRDKLDRFKMAVDNLGGKPAVTHFTVVERFNQYTLLSLKLETGRTHQIRVHMDYIGHPVEGDPLYGRGNHLLGHEGQYLHAYKLIFTHPRTNKKVEVSCELPPYFKETLANLKPASE